MAIDFNGTVTRGFVNTASSNTLQNATAASLSIWCIQDAIGVTQTLAYVATGTNVAAARIGHATTLITRRGTAIRVDGDAATVISQAGGGFANQLNHRLFTVDYQSRALRLYVNGVLGASGLMPTSGNTSNTPSLLSTFGATNLGAGAYNNFMDGRLELVEVWNRVLSDVEANNLFLAKGKLIIGSGLQSRWRLQELEPGANFTDAGQADSGIQKNDGVAGTITLDCLYAQWLATSRRARRSC